MLETTKKYQEHTILGSQTNKFITLLWISIITWFLASEQMERNFKQQQQSTQSSFRQEQYIEISSELDLTWPSNFGLKVDPSISANKSLKKIPCGET